METLKKIGRGVLAGLTSPEAVKLEKSLTALVVTRLVTQLGGATAFVVLIDKLLN